MPWLVRDDADGDEDLLFVHVPRCGGTSLSKHFKLPLKARQGRGMYHRLGLRYFFYRYATLEQSNFPVLTLENLFALFEVLLGFMLWWFGVGGSVDASCDVSTNRCAPGVSSIVMWSCGVLMSTTSTILFTAPMSARIDVFRRMYMLFVGRILFGLTEANNWLTGVSSLGYVVHFTAAKMIKHELVSDEKLRATENFSIVRSPFTRMVSLYGYNRFPGEGFEHFVESWYAKWQLYAATQSTEEWVTYCHVLPMFEFTHRDGKQLVASVIKQENLREIVKGNLDECFAADSKHGTGPIPARVLQALRDMPHANKRKRAKPWQEYYTPRTLALVREMYAADFQIFGYDDTIPGRPDLDRGGDVEKALHKKHNGGPEADDHVDDDDDDDVSVLSSVASSSTLSFTPNSTPNSSPRSADSGNFLSVV